MIKARRTPSLVLPQSSLNQISSTVSLVTSSVAQPGRIQYSHISIINDMEAKQQSQAIQSLLQKKRLIFKFGHAPLTQIQQSEATTVSSGRNDMPLKQPIQNYGRAERHRFVKSCKRPKGISVQSKHPCNSQHQKQEAQKRVKTAKQKERSKAISQRLRKLQANILQVQMALQQSSLPSEQNSKQCSPFSNSKQNAVQLFYESEYKELSKRKSQHLSSSRTFKKTHTNETQDSDDPTFELRNFSSPFQMNEDLKKNHVPPQFY